MREENNELDRRDFMKKGAQATAAAAATVLGGNAVQGAVPADKTIAFTDVLPTRELGKTKVELPILGYGGAALMKRAGNPRSFEDRVKLVRHAYDAGIRYFDTSINYSDSQAVIGEALKGVRDNVFITTKVDFWNRSRPNGRIVKVDRAGVARQVEKNLAELQSDYIDAILIHGTPGVQQMTVEQCMEVHGELAKARDKGLVRFVGFSAHSYFGKALALINSGGFDLCMLSYGFIPRGHNQVFSSRMLELREACVAKAHEQGMGLVAMKVIGAGMLGARSGYVVPGFDAKRRAQLPGAAIRYVLDDDRFQHLVIGMRTRSDLEANLETFSGDVTCTREDRALLAEFGAEVMKSDAIKKMKLE